MTPIQWIALGCSVALLAAAWVLVIRARRDLDAALRLHDEIDEMLAESQELLGEMLAALNHPIEGDEWKKDRES